jgi:hypothetical protein
MAASPSDKYRTTLQNIPAPICDIEFVEPCAAAGETAVMKGVLCILKHLAIVALFARAMLPAGWMPDAQGQMTICSATLGAVHHDTAPGHHDQHAQNEECPFAASSVMAAAPDAPHIALPAAPRGPPRFA